MSSWDSSAGTLGTSVSCRSCPFHNEVLVNINLRGPWLWGSAKLAFGLLHRLPYSSEAAPRQRFIKGAWRMPHVRVLAAGVSARGGIGRSAA